jgi:hypothetical protein
MSYKTWVALDVVGAAILIGNLVVTAVWKRLANRTCEPHAGRTRETGDDHRRRVHGNRRRQDPERRGLTQTDRSGSCGLL